MFGYIKLVFWTVRINFGDLLSPYLIGKLSGKKIIHKNYYEGRDKSIKTFKQALSKFDYLKIINNLLPFESNIVAIGSILSKGNSKSKYWGSGFIDESDSFNGGKVYAVRGRFSADKLVRMGYERCDVYGDPALLLPLIYSPIITKENSIGIIAHINDVEDLKNLCGKQVKVISLASSNIEGVVDEILSCSFIYSTSLHGIIVSHAYNIPAVRIVNSKLYGDDIKFKDYFSSVDIPLYDGFPINEIDLSNQNVDELKQKYATYCLPRRDIKEIQEGLLSVAPFKITNMNLHHVKSPNT